MNSRGFMGRCAAVIAASATPSIIKAAIAPVIGLNQGLLSSDGWYRHVCNFGKHTFTLSVKEQFLRSFDCGYDNGKWRALINTSRGGKFGFIEDKGMYYHPGKVDNETTGIITDYRKHLEHFSVDGMEMAECQIEETPPSIISGGARRIENLIADPS